MEAVQLETLKAWFESYVTGFCDIDEDGRRNIELKIEHTRRVCAVMESLTAGEGLGSGESRTAAAIALLHDVGRFPQYLRWRTFRDKDSDNHGRLAVEVIRGERLLEQLDAGERVIIEEAVRFHNLLDMPRRMQSPTDMYLRLVRDADKLDIWRVFVEQLELPLELRASAAFLGFPDNGRVSAACLQELAARRIVNLDKVTSVDDFKLLLISWAYNLNFSTACRLLREGRFIERLSTGLGGGADAKQAVDAAINYVEHRILPEGASHGA